MATLEKIVDDLSETGARCQTTFVLSSPVPYRPITPPEGPTVQRSRLTRRRRKSVAEEERTGRRPSARAGQEDGVPPRHRCSAGNRKDVNPVALTEASAQSADDAMILRRGQGLQVGPDAGTWAGRYPPR